MADQPPTPDEIHARLRKTRGALLDLTEDLDRIGAEITRALRAHDGTVDPAPPLLHAKAVFFQMQSSLYMVQTHRASLLDILSKTE